ncbi:MAG TPA: riboflavin synthase [Bacillaceae bacterium]
MFTGIIEEIGSLARIERKPASLTITIFAKKVLEDAKIGDSIAVDGVCLTVSRFDSASFEADVMPETFKATTLRRLSPGSDVNLERAMSAGGRFGGHFVTGHVDGTGTIIEKRKLENALYITIKIPEELAPFVMDKGSIAVDGTSLTVFGITGSNVTISLIPVTQKDTILAGKNIGEQVNIECDMLAKYVHRMLKQPMGQKENITMAMLADNGFID